MGQGVEWALHACLNLAWSGEAPVTATRLAALNELSPTSMNKHLQQLVRAGIVRSTSGPTGGFSLARPAAEITVLEIVEAIDGSAGAFRCTEIRRRGPLAFDGPPTAPPCAIAAVMGRAEDAWRRSLAATTLADLSGAVDDEQPEVPVRVGAWLNR